MQDLAEHDQLTGLLNRYAFEQQVKETEALRKRIGFTFGLMLLDLDNFKWINDTYGHDCGDELLKRVAERLEHVCREQDLLCRLGGDEFAIALVGKARGYSHKVAQRIFDSFKSPIYVNELSVNVECSIGIADFENDYINLTDALKKADLAMYHAKSSGKNQFHYFSEELQQAAERRISVESEIRQALTNREFIPYFQPQIDTETKKIIGAEALVRWQHSERGLIGPGEFLDVAEETGQIKEIDQQILEKAIAQRAEWTKSEGIKSDFRIAINISARHLRDESFTARVKSLISKYQLDPSVIELEIVESELVNDFEMAVKVIDELNELGVILAIDDFGTGYSSLSYLKHLKVHTLKVDRSFIIDVATSNIDCNLFKGLINLGQSMKLQIVVEGVENIEQFEKCELYHAEIVQGFYFSKPLDAKAFREFYRSY